MGCHTILGEGAYYAPELTKVFTRRGEAYMKAALMSPVPWSPRGRKMVAYKFSESDANDLVAFFKWIGEIDLNGFPPKPDLQGPAPVVTPESPSAEVQTEPILQDSTNEVK